MKKTTTTRRRGVSPIIAVILLLLMTVAAAGAAYLWITKIQTMMTESVTGSFLQSSKAQGTRFCIDSVWNSTTAIMFTMRNCGEYDVTSDDFNKTGYYIDNVKMACSAAGGAFNSYDLKEVSCPANSYGTCTGEVCPIRAIKVTTVFGKADTVSYQYRP